MIVIGYKARTLAHRIPIPDFHTGHLGYLPGTEVNVLGPYPSRQSCDLLITPFQIDEHIVRVKCTFREAPGVLQRLVNVMSHFSINIMTMESATISQSKFHTIFLLINLAGSNLPTGQISPSEEIQYSYLLPITHSKDRRILTLLAHLIEQCHHILYWKYDGASPVPAISIAPFLEQDFHTLNTQTRVIRRSVLPEYSKRPVSYIDLDLESDIGLSNLVAPHIGESYEDEFDYLLLSETDTRTLRIQFFASERARQLIQIGFRHRDIPGAIDIITRLVAQSKFNILVSLLRKVNKTKSDWEAVLEYQGAPLDAEPPDPREFVREQLKPAIEQARQEAAPYDIELLVPSHIRGNAKLRRPIKLDEQQPRRGALKIPSLDPSQLSSERQLQRILEDTKQIIDANKAKRIFISYPDTASRFKDVLEAALVNEGWTVVFYHGNVGTGTVYLEVCNRIMSCSHFIGIWHPDKDSTDHTSPWMHFELAIAVAYGKEFKLLANTKLHDQKEVLRVIRDMEVIHYTDMDDFRAEAIPAVLKFVESSRIRYGIKDR